jgi:hypothetical protein
VAQQEPRGPIEPTRGTMGESHGPWSHVGRGAVPGTELRVVASPRGVGPGDGPLGPSPYVMNRVYVYSQTNSKI